MSGGRRDVELDLRHRLARDAQIGVAQLRHGNLTTPDSVIDYLVERSYGSAERILDARDLLGEPDLEARALLLRASVGQLTRSRRRIRGRSRRLTLRADEFFVIPRLSDQNRSSVPRHADPPPGRPRVRGRVVLQATKARAVGANSCQR